MAFDPTPTNLFAGMSEDGTTLSIPLASIPGLTSAESDAVTGDSRKIIFSILERFSSFLTDLATEDQPDRVTVTRSRANETTESDVYERSFTFRVKLGGTTLDVSDEPA